MMSKETGGPAFPHDSNWEDRQGMTLRDYFAAKAMQAMLVEPDNVDISRAKLAQLSYAMADAMLKEREE
jgi:hypothetical protein